MVKRDFPQQRVFQLFCLKEKALVFKFTIAVGVLHGLILGKEVCGFGSRRWPL